MSDILIRASLPRATGWSYDDPSGVAEAPLSISVPETLRGGVERAAEREGLTPSEWLVTTVMRGLLSRSSTPRTI